MRTEKGLGTFQNRNARRWHSVVATRRRGASGHRFPWAEATRLPSFIAPRCWGRAYENGGTFVFTMRTERVGTFPQTIERFGVRRSRPPPCPLPEERVTLWL